MSESGILAIIAQKSNTISQSDVCVNGMFLNYASYFNSSENDLRSIVDFLLSEQMGDGGFNCQSNRKGASHSSLHSTLSVIEGILEYSYNGYTYRLKELKKAKKSQDNLFLTIDCTDHTELVKQ